MYKLYLIVHKYNISEHKTIVIYLPVFSDNYLQFNTDNVFSLENTLDLVVVV